MQHLPFAHFHPGCSLLLISTLNSRVNKTCWQHVTACDIKTVYVKTWFILFYQAPAGLCHIRWLSRRPYVYKKATGSCGGVRVEGRKVQLMCANETLLSVSALYHWTKWKLECAAFVQCLCCVLCDCMWQKVEWASAAATSGDNNVTVNLGLCRQCG